MLDKNKIAIMKGNAWVPSRFWSYLMIDKKDLSEYKKNGWIICMHKIKLKSDK